MTDKIIRPDGLSQETVVQDRVQAIAIAIPAAGIMHTQMVQNLVSMDRVENMMIRIAQGPYVAQNMRLLVRDYLKIPDWERLLVIETDMILPKDAIIRHALHTDPVVGSLYFQHAPPFWANVMVGHPSKEGQWAHITAEGVVEMLETPGLWECDAVGLGATSIRRDVLENWPTDIPYFRTEYVHSDYAEDDFSLGEISHDVWFCQRVREQGYKIYVDTNIKCEHLTMGRTNYNHHLLYNKEQLEKVQKEKVARGKIKIVHLPNGAKKYVHA